MMGNVDSSGNWSEMERNGQSREKPKDLFSSASVLPPTPPLPSPRLTAINVRRGQLPSGTKVDTDELALQRRDHTALSPVEGSFHQCPPILTLFPQTPSHTLPD